MAEITAPHSMIKLRCVHLTLWNPPVWEDSNSLTETRWENQTYYMNLHRQRAWETPPISNESTVLLKQLLCAVSDLSGMILQGDLQNNFKKREL